MIDFAEDNFIISDKPHQLSTSRKELALHQLLWKTYPKRCGSLAMSHFLMATHLGTMLDGSISVVNAVQVDAFWGMHIGEPFNKTDIWPIIVE